MFYVYDREIFFKLFMSICRICLQDSNYLKFKTEHIGICQICIDHLNEAPEPAQFSENRIGDLLRKGMAKRNPSYTEAEYQQALPRWLNRLLADPKNNGIDFKRVRAYRRGLLRATGDRRWDYPSDWIERTRRIRMRDQCCQACGECGIPLDVHHIIYLSKYGTNRQENLVSLCRFCHEEEHGKVFDFGEAEEPEGLNPIKPRLEQVPSPQAQPVIPSPSITAQVQSAAFTKPTERASDHWRTVISDPEPLASYVDFSSCPRCTTELTLPVHKAVRGQKLRCKQCGLIFLYEVTTSLAGTSTSYMAPAPVVQQVQVLKTSRDVIDAPRPKPRPPAKMAATDLWVLLAISIFILAIVLMG
ncbi:MULTISPECIES: HNH endonuclease [Giesbergeria]|uniref:HNH endonuclease n=1 Tax=Giesbergeria sinuosa TaxID=80883 RepID=A0ABV9Q9N9_9BURK